MGRILVFTCVLSDFTYFPRAREKTSDDTSKEFREFPQPKIHVVIGKAVIKIPLSDSNALPKSSLGKALTYTKKLLPSFKLIMENGMLEIDNNSAKRSIRPFVIGRKNWQFSTLHKGAVASANLYSIIETARAYHLNAEKYLPRSRMLKEKMLLKL